MSIHRAFVPGDPLPWHYKYEHMSVTTDCVVFTYEEGKLKVLLVQRGGEVRISYDLVGESGPDHNKTFTFTVSVEGETIGEGSGRTKKEAEQMAARRALEKLQA